MTVCQVDKGWVCAHLYCQLDFIWSQLQPELLGTPSRDFLQLIL